MTATGRWNIIIKTPMGNQDSVLELNADGATLTGALHEKNGDVVPITEGQADGNTLSWRAKVKKPLPMSLQFTATLQPARYPDEWRGAQPASWPTRTNANRCPSKKLAKITATMAAPNHSVLPSAQVSMCGKVCVATPSPAVNRLTPETASAITRDAMRDVASERLISREIHHPFKPSVNSMPAMNSSASISAGCQPPNCEAVNANSVAWLTVSNDNAKSVPTPTTVAG